MNRLLRGLLLSCTLVATGALAQLPQASTELIAPEASTAAPEAPPAATVALPTPPTSAPERCQQRQYHAYDLMSQAAGARRAGDWNKAVELLEAARKAFYQAAADCPASRQTLEVIGQAEQAGRELIDARTRLNHATRCQPLLDRGLDLDLEAATRRAGDHAPADIETVLAEAESTWSQAVQACQAPYRERAQRNLEATRRLRATNADQLAGGPACESSWRAATGIATAAREVWQRKRWSEAALLYDKAGMAWESVVERCSGTRRDQARQARASAEVDAHNAAYCAAPWDLATQASEALRTSTSPPTSQERQALSMEAERHWRRTASGCRGNPQQIALANANTLLMERGTPLPDAPAPAAPTALADASALTDASADDPIARFTSVSGAAPEPATAAEAPVPVAALTAPAPVRAPAERASPPPVAAPAETTPSVPPAPADEAPRSVEIVAGDTRYTGDFQVDPTHGRVTGKGLVEWSNGERYVGTILDGRREGAGKFWWNNGQFYDGNWVADQPEGKGALDFSGGDRYEGDMVAGLPEGEGTLRFTSGDRYTGQFRQGQFEGRGLFTWRDGKRYEGNWQAGRKHGRGVVTEPDGTAHTMDFRDGEQLSVAQ
ncbi:MAG: hypothetical protein KDG55_10470 [Rhodocyclaceae bacterium]|nr:hypothetical protein [Rhodocyclaceae bacterium]